MEFTVRLANKNIRIHSFYKNVYKLCKDYLVEDNVDFEIFSTQEDVEKERDESGYSSGYLETLSIYRKIATKMLEYDTFLMHGSIVATDSENAYMFTASSGTGKTTHTMLWLKNIQESFVVNGDKPLLIVEDNRVLACGSPWSGKEGMNKNCTVPLKGIVILERDESNLIEEISFKEGFAILFQQTYRPKNPMELKKTLELLQGLSHSVKIYRMKVNNFKEDAFSTAFQITKNS